MIYGTKCFVLRNVAFNMIIKSFPDRICPADNTLTNSTITRYVLQMSLTLTRGYRDDIISVINARIKPSNRKQQNFINKSNIYYT